MGLYGAATDWPLLARPQADAFERPVTVWEIGFGGQNGMMSCGD